MVFTLEHRIQEEALHMSVTIATRADELLALADEWDALSRSATEPNIFYERWMLLPALNRLATEPIRIVLVWDNAKRLIGLFPLTQDQGYRRLPISSSPLWKYAHCFLCTPLIKTGAEEECLSQFLNWASSGDEAGRLLRFDTVAGDGPFYHALTRVLAAEKRGHEELDTYHRAVMQTSLSVEEYLQQSLSAKQLRNLRRTKKRLSELGTVEYKILTSEASLSEWIEHFLLLEQSGWKGKEGTALACSENERLFFEEITQAAHARKQLLMTAIELNGEPVAMDTAFVSGNLCFGFKCAYDDAFATYSPGKLLHLENVRTLLTHPQIRSFDSCVSPDGGSNSPWNERRIIKSITVSTSQVSKFIVSGLSYVEKVRTRARPAEAFNEFTSRLWDPSGHGTPMIPERKA